MTTIVAEVRLLASDLHSRKVLAEARLGIPVGPNVSTAKLKLESDYVIDKVTNFFMLVTDVPVFLHIDGREVQTDYGHQTTPMPDQGVVLTPSPISVHRITGIYLAYTSLGKVWVSRDPQYPEVPNIELVYS